MTADRPPSNPIGLAFEWVARITVVGLMMVVPGIGGTWLADRLELPFLTLIGWIVGLVGGFAFLLVMTGVWKSRRGGSGRE